MAGFDAFASNMFSLRALTDAINIAPYRPGRLGKMGLFEPEGVRVRAITIEEYDGVLAILPTQRVGGPATLKRTGKRKARSFEIPHIPYDHRILAADLAGIREFGTENELQSVGKEVNRHLKEMRQDHEATHEWHRMGAVTGNILDADGTTVIYNLFNEFNTAEQTLDMDLGTAGTSQHEKGLDLKDLIETPLGETSFDHVHVLCEKAFYRKLIKNTQINTAYDRWLNGEFKRSDPRFKGFEFPEGVIWEEYRRAQNTVGSLDFIAAGEARAFPVGVPRLFKSYWGPGTKISTVNVRGIPMFASQYVDPKERWVDLDTESNPLMMCTRPRTLIRLTSST